MLIVCHVVADFEPDVYLQNALGNVMMVHALKDFEQGEEITIAYTNCDDYLTRSERLKPWIAECLCTRCIRERHVSPGRQKLRRTLRNVPTDVEQHMNVSVESASKRRTLIHIF